MREQKGNKRENRQRTPLSESGLLHLDLLRKALPELRACPEKVHVSATMRLDCRHAQASERVTLARKELPNANPEEGLTASSSSLNLAFSTFLTLGSLQGAPQRCP